MDNEQTSTTTEEVSTQEPSTDVSTTEEITESSIEEALNSLDEEPKVEDNSSEEDSLVADVEASQEDKSEPKVEEPQDKGQIDFPDKFKHEDGTPDYDKLLNSYKELESNFTKKTQELNDQLKAYQEQEQQALQKDMQAKGFDNEVDYRVALMAAENIANNYAQYLEYSDDPDYVRGLLINYAQNPDASLLKEIEDNFSFDVVKHVTAQSAVYTDSLLRNYEQQQQQEYNNRIQNEATEYVTKAYEEYPEWFARQEFVDFFGDALRVKGNTFEASAFVNHVQKIWDLAQQSLINDMKEKNENSSAIKALTDLTPKSTPKITKSMENMSESELASAISEYI